MLLPIHRRQLALHPAWSSNSLCVCSFPHCRLLTKTSEGTFLYDRVLPAQDESTGGYNAEAGLSAFISKRLVDALLTHRQERAEQAQRELEVRHSFLAALCATPPKVCP